MTFNGMVIDDNERTKCEIWSRVMGYARPVGEWNLGKQSEFRDRKMFILPTVEELEQWHELKK